MTRGIELDRHEIKTPLISIILPVYNVQQYIHLCIDSILAQSLFDYELLLIDDGSTDNCGDICEEYALKDSRIRVFHQSNEGLSSARNTGLNHAMGRFITMIDSDDILLSTEYLRILHDTIRDNDADMSMCGYIRFFDGEDIPLPLHVPEKVSVEFDPLVLNGVEFNYWHNIPPIYVRNFLPGKLYKSCLFNDVRFPVGRIFEDIATQHKLTFPCRRIAFSRAQMYGYRTRHNGIAIGTPIDIRIRDYIIAMQERMDYFKSKGYPDLAAETQQILLRWLYRHKNENR